MPRLRLIDRKLSRKTDQRGLLIKTLATQLITHHSISTSVPKAKVLVPYVERLVSRSLRGDLAARRYVRARVDTVDATHHLLDVIAPQMQRTSGFIRLKKSGFRVGDHTPMATVSFVDPITAKPLSTADDGSKKTTTKKPEAPAKAKKEKKS